MCMYVLMFFGAELTGIQSASAIYPSNQSINQEEATYQIYVIRLKSRSFVYILVDVSHSSR